MAGLPPAWLLSPGLFDGSPGRTDRLACVHHSARLFGIRHYVSHHHGSIRVAHPLVNPCGGQTSVSGWSRTGLELRRAPADFQ
jgi:hypothetical protein